MYLTGGANLAINTWLRARGLSPGPLFCQVFRLGRVTPVRLSKSGIYAALRRRAPEAGVRRFSPHDLRRTFVSDLLDAGADLPTVQRQAGRASPATTERYDRRGDHAKRRAASLVRLPYNAPPGRQN